MLLSYTELVNEVVSRGVVTGVGPTDVNAASIDLTLGDIFYTEREPTHRGMYTVVDLAKRESIEWEHAAPRMREGYLDLAPGEFILTHTTNKFYMPDDLSAEYSLKSSLARNGLEHLLAGWIDPGFTNSVLTLEFKNVSRFNILRIRPGMKIGQVKFFRHTAVPAEQSYRVRGRYNNDSSVAGIKP